VEAEKRIPAKLTPEVTRSVDISREEEPAPLSRLAGGNAEGGSPVDSIQYASVNSQISSENPFPQELTPIPDSDPASLLDRADEASAGEREPVKITIEYIASGSKTHKTGISKTHLGEFYSKMNKLVYPEEVLGDIRSLKDQLFALEFINRKSTQTQNNKEK
jgi:hypothetical protein